MKNLYDELVWRGLFYDATEGLAELLEVTLIPAEGLITGWEPATCVGALSSDVQPQLATFCCPKLLPGMLPRSAAPLTVMLETWNWPVASTEPL